MVAYGRLLSDREMQPHNVTQLFRANHWDHALTDDYAADMETRFRRLLPDQAGNC